MNLQEIIKDDIKSLKALIEKWIKDNDLGDNFNIELYPTHMNDEPTNRALNLVAGGQLYMALNGHLGDDILISFENLIDETNFFYEPENYYSYNFFFSDEKLDKELQELNQWPWVCMLLEESYHEINEELYSFLSKDEKYIQKLDWRSFEKLLDGIFKNQGYRTELGSGQNDGGVDIKLYNKDGIGEIITYVQAKRYNKRNPIKLEAVAALYGVMNADSVDQGIFVTSSRYLPVARKFADKTQTRLRLKESNDVLEWCKSNSQKIFQSKKAVLKQEFLINKLQSIKRNKQIKNIVYHSYGALGVSNQFYMIAEDYGKYMVCVPISSLYNSNSGLGYEEPNFHYKFDVKIHLYDSEIVKKTILDNGHETIFGIDYIFNYWNGKPLYYDWHD